MLQGVTYRRATPADAEALVRIKLSTAEETASHFLEDDIFAWRQAQTPEKMAQKLSKDCIKCWLAEKNGQPVGYITRRAGMVGELFVDQAYLKQNIGRGLYQELEKDAQNSGLALLILEASPFAIKFYEKQGFEKARDVCGRVYDGVQVRCGLMSKWLLD